MNDNLDGANFQAGFAACSASRDAEVEELVELMITFALYYGDDEFSPEQSKFLDSFLSRYTKTLCPECGGSGQKTIISGQTPETYDTVNTDCPTCKGIGYKWEREE